MQNSLLILVKRDEEIVCEIMKIIFITVQGERRFFRICYKYLAEIDPVVALLNLYNIPIYGRWDDVIDLIDSSISYIVLNYIS